MKHRKVTLSAVLLWGVVAYALALLTYCTMKSVLSASADNISAFGSILGACAAFFAVFVAAYLFNDWKEQHNKQVQNDFALKTYNQFKKFELALFKANDTFSNLSNIIDWNNEIDLPLDDSKVKESQNEMNLMFSQVHEAEYEFKNFMSQLVDYCVVTNQGDNFLIIQKDLYRQFFKFYNNEDELSYSSYNQFWKNYSWRIQT